MSKKGTAAMYGMVASVPDKTIVDDFVVQFFNQIYQLGWLHSSVWQASKLLRNHLYWFWPVDD